MISMHVWWLPVKSTRAHMPSNKHGGVNDMQVDWVAVKEFSFDR